MMSNYTVSILDFLKSKDIVIKDINTLNDSDNPLCINVDGEIGVFFCLHGNDRIVLFTFTADFYKMSMYETFVVIEEAMKLNNFKRESFIQFFIDDSAQYLVSWCSTPFYVSDIGQLHKKFDKLVGVNRVFRKNHNIDFSTFVEK